MIAGLGAVGGLAIGKWAFDHLFVEGMTTAERRNILIFSGTAIAWYALDQLFGIEKQITTLMEQADAATR